MCLFYAATILIQVTALALFILYSLFVASMPGPTSAMKKGCWLGCAAGCPGENASQSRVCIQCWATATPSKLQAVKFEYNLYTDQPYCKVYGCWNLVQRKNIQQGICKHQLRDGKCQSPCYTLPRENTTQFRRARSHYQVRERPISPSSQASNISPPRSRSPRRASS